MSGTVLFLGASGKVARHAAPVFEAAGWRVRMYDRSRGDMGMQARGADVIVNGLNPPNYHNWRKIIPGITRDVIAAARASGATVIIPGNVYVYGDTRGMWSEDTPHRPVSRKGSIRKEMEQRYREAGVRTILLRAGDFIAAQSGDTDVMGSIHLRQLTRGRVVSPGNPDTLHAYGYLPDWAQAARLLAECRTELPVFADANLGGANFTARQLRDALSADLQRPLQLVGFPWPALRLLSPFWELARELREMRYLWEVSHGLTQDRLLAWIPGYQPTDLRQIMLAGARGGRADGLGSFHVASQMSG